MTRVKIKQASSFHEALLHVLGVTKAEDVEFEDVEEDDFPENKWYKEPKEPEVEFSKKDGSAPIIHVTDEEINEWSEPWRLTLVVNVMGKKVNFRMLEISLLGTRLEREASRLLTCLGVFML